MTFPGYAHLLQSSAETNTVAVVVEKEGLPAGMALGAMPASNDPAPPSLFSLFVVPELRNQGLGTALMLAFLEEVRRRGGALVSTVFMRGKPAIAWFESILNKTGWAAPVARMVAIKAEMAQIRRMDPPWLRQRRIDPAKFTLVPWSEVTEAQKSALKASHEREAWIAPDLVPWIHEKDYDPVTSMALLQNGELVSWVINHLMLDGTTRFTCSFAHPKLQRLGVVFWLYKEAVDRMEQNSRVFGMWTVPLHHAGMHAFAMRWMRPCAVHFRETLRAQVLLN